MKKLPIKIISTQDSGTLQIRYFPTDICNFNCSYCFPGSHDAKYRYPKNLDTVVSNFKKLFNSYKNKNKFHLVIAGGGEPTMWPELETFCKRIKEEHNVFITIVTNGSRTLRWWEENSSYFDDVVLSCHHEEVDIDHFIKVADMMFYAGASVTALMLMSAAHWDKCVSYIEKMKQSKNPWYIEAKPIVDAPGQGVDIYTEEQSRYIEQGLKRIPDSEWLFRRINDLKLHQSVVLFDDDTAMPATAPVIIANNWNKFFGWKCNVGLESLSIAASGDVSSSCGAKIFNKPMNIHSEVFEIDSEANKITCPFNECLCQPDTHVTKFKV